MRKLFVFSSIFFIAVGCGTKTSIVRIVDESFRDVEFSVIAVSTPIEDLEIRSRIEGLFQNVLKGENLIVYKAMDLLPPLNPYSYEQFVNVMDERGVQCVLVVGVTDFWTNYYTTPSVSITETEVRSNYQGTFHTWGSLFGVRTTISMTGSSKSISKTRQIPGITISQSNVKLDVRLFVVDPNNRPKVIWRANSTTLGEYFMESLYVMEDAAYRIGVTLVEDGLIKE